MPPAPNSTDIDFDRTVDAVDDLGWDPTGEEAIDVPLEDGLLVEAPPGEYRVDETQSGAATRWGLVGLGETPEDVRFVGPDGKPLRVLQLTRGSRDVLVENVAFDHGDAIPGCLGNAFLVEDGLYLTDVHYVGTTPAETPAGAGATSLLPLYVFEEDGVAVLDGVEMTGPSELVKYPENPLAIFAGQEHAGTLYIRNSRFANRGEHAIYASRCVGDVRIENCWFKNNQNTQARISGAGSYVKDSKFITDVDGHPNHGEFQATTGLTFESGFQGFAGGLIEGCEFIVPSSANNSGCLKIDGSHGSVTVRDCTFDVADDVTPILVQAPGDSHMIDGLPEKPWPITLDSVHVTSVGAPDYWSDAAVTIDGRDGTALTDCCVSADGRDALCCMDGTYDVTGGSLSATGSRSRVAGAAIIRQDGVGVDADCATDLDELEEGSDETGDSGDDGDETMQSYAHDLIVKGTNGVTHYEIDVSGEAGFVTEGDFQANPGDGDLDDRLAGEPGGPTTITGAVASSGGDSYTFDGTVEDVRVLEGAAPSVVVDGERLDLAQFDADEEGDSGGDGEVAEQTVVVEATGTKGYVEPVVDFDGELATEPDGSSYTLYAEQGRIAFSTREGWRHEFVVAGDVVDVAIPPGVSVSVDGEAWGGA